MTSLLGMPRWLRNAVLLIVDSVVLIAAPIVALFLRFEGPPPSEYLAFSWWVSGLRVAASLAVLARFGLYRSLWRYAGPEETLRMIWGATTAAALLLGDVILVFHLRFPRSVLLISWLIMVAGLGGIRFMARMLRRRLTQPGTTRAVEKRTLIVGAGDAGAMVAAELHRHPELGSLLLGFVDDDPSKRGLSIHGAEVLGSRSELAKVVVEHRVSEVIVAMPSASGTVVQELVTESNRLGLSMRIVPGMYELLDGKVSVSHLREVKLEDLLNRIPAEMDLDAISSYLTGARVMVTGAAGSIGSELCRQIARFHPSSLCLVDADESGLYNLQHELRWRQPNTKITVDLVNIREEQSVETVFQRHMPKVVFHAAALKHVPQMEQQPCEAVKTNVIGTLVVARAAVSVGTSRFVLISTDKAVNPTSVMGATKRVSEYIGQALTGHPTVFLAVRFGNVLGSRGSVVPLFQSQIARGGPVTVTHPDMTRYFMTIPEATQLVIQGGAFGFGGEVFVLDMGEPIRIVDLARNLIQLSGLECERDIAIEFTGVRPGERLHEEVLMAEEGVTATRHERIFVARSAGMPYGETEFWRLLRRLSTASLAGDDAVVRSLLHEMVPTYLEAEVPPINEGLAATHDIA